ncbi:ABC-F family ATP-binding cassette domain-containing protein [Candidatus Woesebacteria bacterium]|nr:ABC-F family ATP-binding cassette domain-containing protein [Candidatus Woesebacteria bacterium]
METIIKFDHVSFHFGLKPILDDVSFSVKKGMKIALMGQNGAGKSTLFKLLTQSLQPESGQISVDKKLTVATAFQVIAPEDKELAVEAYFQKMTGREALHEVRSRMSVALDAVNLIAPAEKLIKSFSGGQQARLLLAAALSKNPDLLLLDEPTNNLDYDGIAHLTQFLIGYPKSCIVISHDAEFLNSFTEGVLYLDSHTRKIEQYAGNYHDVVADIAARIEKQNRQNALMEKGIQENKDKANFFAQKGGKMRNVAKKMWEKIEKLESEKVDVRKEDKTIRPFTIPMQPDVPSDVLHITSVTVMQNHQLVEKKRNVFLSRGKHMLIIGPNGMGKSTLIDAIARGNSPGVEIKPGVKIGYYSQDFATLEYDDIVYDSLKKALGGNAAENEQKLRSIAAGFLLSKDQIFSKVGSLSEGQKGLLAFARLVLMEPGLLILDEPTNHINFRHLPIIAEALDSYKGAMILVSHVTEFWSQIKIDEVLDLEG